MYLFRRVCLLMFVFLGARSIHCGSQSEKMTKGEMSTRIEAIVQKQYGNEYKVGVEIIDSILDEKREKITDPYGTLRGCVLFSGVRYFGDQESGFFGLYKEGKILWTSDRIIGGVWNATFATEDINKDGKVDILTTWYTGGDPAMEYLWILSWDGKKGQMINQWNSIGESNILGANFKLVAHDSTGVRDIIATDDSRKSGITTFYRWDGTHYVYDREIERKFNEGHEDH